MAKLHFATEIEREPEADAIECSWSSVIRGIDRYAAYQPASVAEDLRQWVNLLEGMRQLREED
jgi:hypothetical protein